MQTFNMPPLECSWKRELRRVGFEFEFAGLSLARSAEIVARLFGGRVEAKNRFSLTIEGTRLGTFSAESDASLLKELRYESYLRKMGLDPDRSDFGRRLEGWIES